MRENRSQYAILSLLRLGPMSGYDIKTACESLFSHFWTESFGSIYPILNKLENLHQVRSHEDDKQTSGRRRRVYQITAAGRKALRTWLSKPPVERSLRDELYLKLFNATFVPADVHRSHIEQQQTQFLALNQELAERMCELEAQYSESPDFKHWRLVLRAGQLSCDARLKWCREALDELSEH
ncbi:MAG: PadR family transcriptional regulator [Aureliella sp.]